MNQTTANVIISCSICATVLGAVFISKDPDYLWGLLALLFILE